MGMAASQARFLSLTARKSNTEYEGQQINQERTALANESANLYSQLTKLDVPTPPATSDFYKTVYSFSSSDFNDEKAQIKYSLQNIQATPDGDVAIVSHDVKQYQAFSYLELSGSSAKDPNSDTTGYKAGERTYINKSNNSTTYSSTYNVDGGLLSGMLYNHGTDTYAIYLEEVDTHQATLDTLGSNDYVTSYTFNGAKKDYLSYVVIDNQKYYFTKAQLENQPESADNKKNGSVSIAALQGVKQITQTVTEELPIVRYETNNVGRYTSLTINVEDKDGKPTPKTFTLDCVRTQDEEAYEQAMRDYEYYQAKYEKSVADINAKTEDIQQKDKTLELELKQLDTEQNAIKTEMDAVQKVVEDNVESTFKTFG